MEQVMTTINWVHT